MGLISARHISKVFGESPGAVVALKDVSLDIEKGEFIAIMGPSGSGKTTFLSILGAMSAPTCGEVVIDGVSLYSLSVEELADFRARRLGFVFQQLHLISYLNAIENVMLPLLISREHASLKDIACSALQQVGLVHKAHYLPGQLSSGEQARVAIARAIVKAPPIILADEPTGNLDSRTGQDIVHLLQAANERGHTIIMVTHNKDVAGGAQRLLYLRDGMITAGDE
jgi:putative ABC transport system ATP-binding protein